MKNKLMYSADDHFKELMRDPEFRRAWKETEPEYVLATKLIEARLKKKVSQRALAKRLRTSQAVISRIETMTANPSLAFMKRLARALGSKIILRFQ